MDTDILPNSDFRYFIDENKNHIMHRPHINTFRSTETLHNEGYNLEKYLKDIAKCERILKKLKKEVLHAKANFCQYSLFNAEPVELNL